jgi:uncharacterized DUF497 family protein
MTRFQWDLNKAASNIAKHKVSFELAARVFADPFAFSESDFIHGEERWRTIGAVSGVLVLLVAHTIKQDDGSETIRIISARQATASERQRYGQQRY